MQPEALVKLIGSGNTSDVEAGWQDLVESSEISPARLAQFGVVLSQLCDAGRNDQAETLAWVGIEATAKRHSPTEALHVAGPFLLAIRESEVLRAEVTELYRTVYAGREGLDELLRESGLNGGRPVRRALRTLEVCLHVEEGGYLSARDEEGAARVESIDRAAWMFDIVTGLGTETLGAVALADQYQPAAADDFRVMGQFAPEQLVQRVSKDPAGIVLSVCRMHGHTTDSGRIESLLVPDLIPAADWKKWWTRARTALKRNPNVLIEGRSPYTITYVNTAVNFDTRLMADFKRLREPAQRWACIERYLRDCKTRNESPSKEVLRECYESFARHAANATTQGAAQAGFLWLIARRVGEAIEIADAADGIRRLLSSTHDFASILQPIEDPALVELACASLIEARPDHWQEQLLAALPVLPMPVCDWAVSRLIEVGRSASDFDTIIQTMLASPVAHFEALLWLWDGPSNREIGTGVTPVTILSRILRALEECRRDDRVPKAVAKRINTRARAVLAARNYKGFVACLDTIEGGMATALRTHISKLDNLGRVVREDLLSHLNRRFPLPETRRQVEPWAREDCIFVTATGMARKQEQIEQHVNVKMRKNAQAIGEAAEKGDLSENSEYKFALEERDLLRAMLAQMNSEVASAVILATEDVPTDHIGVGTRAVFRRVTDGQGYEISFLGPWEAALSENLLNYKAPLAQSLMGKRVGDVVEFNHAGIVGSFELVELHNALQPETV